MRYSICKSGHDDNGDGDGDSDGDSDGDGDGDGGGDGDGDGDGGLEPVKLFSSCIFDLMKQLFDRLILVPRIKIVHIVLHDACG